MSGVPPERAGHIKRLYDYRCAACGWQGERRVPLARRDRQRCPSCRQPAKRLPHFRTVGFRIPGYMRSTYDETEILPDDEGERERFERERLEVHG